ncbi:MULTISPECIES: proline iminopeptidase-family hydrolase [unclassified Polaribacter]|uniref:proline iminopeptidase-family hydrolase n=1 Tax=unclassified Polaribacter TaxID=196858 RepID=UPI0011BEB75E|nr:MULTISPECIES: proline iminopeptidase-family hydrolase [unclassified Polaribacter]TXD51491.1 alpha/beta fold hydrolase [Polaribacter sp. IC063]TXD61781.1 alpha/beta fold hydrolase [Polaribacter sp. IC066]
MKPLISTVLILLIIMTSCTNQTKDKITNNEKNSYFDYSNSDDQATGGIKMIPIETPKGTFNVYTKRMGNNPTMRVLLLHGGPGVTHEIFDNFDGYFPNEEIEYIYYDQLDSYYSDKPNDSTLWTTEHFVEEVEQVRKALNLNKDNFYLLGQSWGGILAMEYALKYQDNLKGLIISNMMASAPEYTKYANEVLGPQMDPEVLKEIMDMEANNDFENPRYNELLINHYYTKHILRKPVEEWPKSMNLAFEHLNPNIYIFMQGHSEFGMTGNASLKNWDVSGRLKEIRTPTLMLGAKYDTMDPKYMEWMATEVQNGRSFTTNGSHCSQFDAPETYFPALIKFIKDVDSKEFK